MHIARRRLTILCALVITIVGAMVIGWSVLGTDVPWQSARVQGDRGNTIVISYIGSECEDSRSIKVAEDDPSAVTITVTARSFRPTCSDVAVRRTAVVELDAALGERALLDGSCNAPADCRRSLLD